MTPRQADVSFVLESIEGVRALYRIDAGGRAAAGFDFAVETGEGFRVLAAIHYALLRVMTHDDCARVFLFRSGAPRVIMESAHPLELTESEREAARRRVPPPAPRPETIGPPVRLVTQSVLVVDDDAEVEAVVRQAVQPPARWALVPDVEPAAKLARAQPFDLILCDVRRAFGLHGLLANLPMEVARHVLVLAEPSEVESARWRLQGSERILTRPLEGWLLQERLGRACVMPLSPPPDLARVTATELPRRRIETPAPSAPFTVLLVDVEDELHEALRFMFREEARHLSRRDPIEAAEVALSTPLHVVICSVDAAMHPGRFLDAVAREDPTGADRVIVVAPASDVHRTQQRIEQSKRKNTVLALPIDYTLLRRAVFRDHPALVARVAVAEVADTEPSRVKSPRFRRLAVLVVDDEATTEILFAAAAPRENADVALATSAMEAFEHILSRAVDVLIVSATMRGDGGEPFYRVLWRLKPELKGRCVLIAPHDAVPLSAPPSEPPRILERPLTRDAIKRTVSAFARR